VTTKAVSLAPTREQPTPIAALASSPVVAVGLTRIGAAIARHFPENVFADLDRMAALLEALRTHHGDARALAHADRIAHVHALFGCETVLRFRYAHDFLYGFDWARWVARDPRSRASVGPYDDAFLDYSAQRAAELAALVEAGDRKYGPLVAGAHRNPFPFRRDLDAERTLHRALAADGAIPVRAWEASGTDAWDRDFTVLREEKARALGLSADADAE
jgi:hypothetical protein